MHHALIDGVSAMKLMRRRLSADPDDTEVRAIWNLPWSNPTSDWAGCRRSVPHLQRLLGYLESSLKDLEQAVGI
jgi:Wax ester synthase-like Acyl-CoA acyltransferase domain